MIINTSKKSLCVMYLLLIVILTVFLNCKDSNPVTPHIPVEKIVLSDTQISLDVGETRKLTATIEPENATNRELIWSSEDEEIATISDDGVITALAYGQVSIFVSVVGSGLSAECIVTVAKPVEFTVTNLEEWRDAVSFISSNGNDKKYFINIMNDFETEANLTYNFGSTTGITVNINGNPTKTPTIFGRLGARAHQEIIITDIILDSVVDERMLQKVQIGGEGAIFTMQGNSVIKNSLNTGVIVRNFGTFIMLDGIITENIAEVGAGVRVEENGTFIMKGGTITKNSTRFNPHFETHGGGVYIEDGTFIMSGGTITDNFSHNFGGGVHATGRGVFNISGGFIYQNTSLSFGFNVYMDKNTIFMMSDGVIGPGGLGVSLGIFPIDNVSGTMTGGIIMGTSSGLGVGGSGSFIMSGGIIYGRQETGVPENLANYQSFSKSDTATGKYGDGADILPHIDGNINRTIYTVKGNE
ncbi:MAG: Ig-like domain-containing protein [Candidatus Cloacimonetes bacterium]|nr:Ig-like domain-containing protein [Candidatus Cloacimonadota bacterium]